MTQTDCHKNSKGFVLIIVAAVMVILGAILLTTFPVGSDIMAKNVGKTEDKIKVIKRAILIYYEENGAMPCPALNTLASSADAYGKADCTIAGLVKQGGVPFKTLGLPASYAYDDWKRRFTYVMDSSYTGYFGEADNIDVNDAAGVDIVGANGGTIPQFMGLIISHGDNAKGSYTQRGGEATPAKACGTAPNTDDENCNGDAVFIKDGWSDTNDDLVEYLTPCPAAVNGCSLWLDASKANSVLDDDGEDGNDGSFDGRVAEWLDMSGNGIGVSGLVAADYPEYKLAEKNGKNTLYFDGVANELFNANSTINSKSVIALATYEGGTTYASFAALFGHNTHVPNNFTMLSAHQGSRRFWPGVLVNTNSYSNGKASIRGEVGDLSEYNIFSFANDNFVFDVNPTVGVDRRLGGRYWDGNVSEIITYDVEIDADQRTQIQCGLARKWGVFPKDGLTLWLDATDVDGDGDATNNPSDGTSVSPWVDKSGSSNDMVTTATAPTLEAHPTLAGKQVIEFTSSQNLRNSMSFPSTWTIIYIGRWNGGASKGRMLRAFTNNWLMGTYGVGTKRSISAWYNGNIYLTGNATNDENWRVYSGKADASNGYFYSDSELHATSPTHKSPPVGGLAFNVGPHNEQSDMQIVELVAYNRTLSDEEQQITECYLSAKWGVDIGANYP